MILAIDAFCLSQSHIKTLLLFYSPTALTDIHTQSTYNHDLTKSETLTHQTPRGHVLFGLNLTKVEGTWEHQHVYHNHETGQESNSRLWRHALCCLDVFHLRLAEATRGKKQSHKIKAHIFSVTLSPAVLIKTTSFKRNMQLNYWAYFNSIEGNILLNTVLGLTESKHFLLPLLTLVLKPGEFFLWKTLEKDLHQTCWTRHYQISLKSIENKWVIKYEIEKIK